MFSLQLDITKKMDNLDVQLDVGESIDIVINVEVDDEYPPLKY